MSIPDVLFHRVLGGYSGESARSIEHAIESIMETGLVPKVAEEYKGTVPEEIRGLPVVWLGRNFSSHSDQVLAIRTKCLDPENLYDLRLDDVDWWVYQGEIPPEAIHRVVNNMGSIKRSEVAKFASKVIKALDLDDWEMQWSKTEPSICLREQKVILIRRAVIEQYPWQAKEEVLHEIAHIFTPDRVHGENFYREYILLLERFMVEEPL